MNNTQTINAPDFDDYASPNDAQRAASDPYASVWVNASAGSGKTTVLTGRVTRLLLENVPPERILCLTFTRAAAAEMANRVTKQLSRWATCSDDDLRKDLDQLQGTPPTPHQLTAARRLFARVLACPGGMRIRTLHAFCQEILRRFPIESGLSPHFTVMEENDARTLQEDVKAELLHSAARDPDSKLGRALKTLVGDLGEHGFGEAMRGLLAERARLAAALNQQGDVETLITSMRSSIGLEPDDTTESIARMAVDFSVLPLEPIKQAARLLLEGSKLFSARGKDILTWLNRPLTERAARLDDYLGCFFTDKGDPFAKWANKELLTKHPDLEETLNREAMRLQSLRERLDTAALAENTAAILTFGAELAQRYDAQKRTQAVMDYDDLIRRTHELLHRPGIAPWILYKLDGGLDHILVDEAQDTSRAQWSIVAALAEEFFSGLSARTQDNRTLFVVGDEKQSIFSFQHADPEAFISMRRFFAQRIHDAGKLYRPVPLRTSFRSAPAILRAVDYVFAADPVRSGVSMEPVQHHAHKQEKRGHVEIWPLIKPPEKEKTEDEAWDLPLDYEKEHDPQAELAAHIADTIKNWVMTKERLAGENRAITPGDIMILLRRRGRFADLMVRALKERSVPVTGVDRMRLTQQLSVMDLLALIQSILLPQDDLTLATVLRGPLVNLSEDLLMQLAIGRSGTLWQSLAQQAENNPTLGPIHTYLLRHLNEADFMSPFAMLARTLNEPCPGHPVSGRAALWSRLGLDALDPLDELLNAAQNFSQRHTPSLQAFLHWLMATEAEIKRELDHGGGQVRIMTVHASKGLEAPIVFLPDTASLPRLQDMPKFLWSDENIPLYVARKPTMGSARTAWDTARQRQMEEYRRLLYVALTRAANRLYVGGWEPARKEPNSDESWYQLILTALKGAATGIQGPQEAPSDSRQPLVTLSDPELRSEETNDMPQPTASNHMPLPDWAQKAAPAEPGLLKQVAPSQLASLPSAATPDLLFARGRIIHRLLQSLPEIDATRRDDVATHFLSNPQHHLTPAQQAEVKSEVMNLLNHPDAAPLFGPGSRAEVPLVGRIGNEVISGQVDRLCLREDSVWIVDYKTNRPPPADETGISDAYRQQMESYRTVLQAIYPTKAIRCFLLWTYGARLMEVSPL